MVLKKGTIRVGLGADLAEKEEQRRHRGPIRRRQKNFQRLASPLGSRTTFSPVVVPADDAETEGDHQHSPTFC